MFSGVLVRRLFSMKMDGCLLFQDASPTNDPATFGTFRGLILRSQLIILLKQKVSICRNVIVTCLSCDPG